MTIEVPRLKATTQTAAVGTNTAARYTGGAWTIETIPAGTYNGITYGNSLYVTVGTNVCATSPDGETWTSRTIPAGTYNKVTWAEELALFIAVGNNVIATSPNGITWTSRTPPAANNWTGVAWDGTTLVIVSSDGDNRTATSTDGITWTLQTASADFSLAYTDGITHSIERGTKEVHFLWRDEAGTTHTEGDTDKPQWNLGYLESTDSPPSTRVDPFYKFRLACVPVRLDITDGDRVHFDPFWTLDPAYPTDAQVLVSEKFNTSKTPAWYQDIESLSLFNSVEGGSLPSTIERVAAYTPLVTTGFDGNLDSTVNNLQALADRVDDLNLGSAPTTTAANDFQVGNGAGAWIKKTLAETITILRTSLDLIFAPIAKGVTNGDSHDHNGGDGAAIVEAAITLADNTTNNVSTTKHGFTPKAPNDTAKFLRGDASWAAVPGLITMVTLFNAYDTDGNGWGSAGRSAATYTFDLQDANNNLPSGITGVLIFVQAKWATVTDGSTQLRIRPRGGSTSTNLVLQGQANNIRNTGFFVCPVDATYEDIEIEVVGATSVTNLKIAGYIK